MRTTRRCRCPTQVGARIAVATQNILREEAHLTDVIDPLGGSYYVETLTDEMEAKIVAVMDEVEDAGGMYARSKSGLVQRRIGESAQRFQARVESGEQAIVGVNAYKVDEDAANAPRGRARIRRVMQAHLDAFAVWKARARQRGRQCARRACTRAAESDGGNMFGAVVDGAASRGDARRDLRDAAPRARLRPSARRRLTWRSAQWRRMTSPITGRALCRAERRRRSADHGLAGASVALPCLAARGPAGVERAAPATAARWRAC